MKFLQVKDMYKIYKMGDNEIVANNAINFDVEKGELVVILRTFWCRKVYNIKYNRWNGNTNIRKRYSRWC